MSTIYVLPYHRMLMAPGKLKDGDTPTILFSELILLPPLPLHHPLIFFRCPGLARWCLVCSFCCLCFRFSRLGSVERSSLQPTVSSLDVLLPPLPSRPPLFSFQVPVLLYCYLGLPLERRLGPVLGPMSSFERCVVSLVRVSWVVMFSLITLWGR